MLVVCSVLDSSKRSNGLDELEGLADMMTEGSHPLALMSALRLKEGCRL